MKKFIILALLSVVTLHAQRDVEVKESLAQNQDLYLNFQFANDIKVVHSNSNEVVIKANVMIDDGEGNDFYSIKSDKSSGRLKLYSDFGDYYKTKRDNNYWNNCDRQTTINYTVYVPKNVELKIKSISGSVYIDTFEGDLITDLISGDVTIKKYKGELRLKSISGALDVTVNKARLNAKSLTGTIYSNIEFEKDDSERGRSHSHNRVRKQINGGSLPLDMETISGNIYIRKG